MSSVPSNRLTPPIVEPPIADNLDDEYVPYEPKAADAIPQPDDLDAVLKNMKAKRSDLLAANAQMETQRVTLFDEIKAAREEIKRLDRFIAAETPRGSKPKTK